MLMIRDIDWQKGKIRFSFSLFFLFLQFHRKPLQAQKGLVNVAVTTLSCQRNYRHSIVFLTISGTLSIWPQI